MLNYIPDYIIHQYISNRRSGEFPSYVLFIDISGFTAMTERLMEHNKAGAEVLADIINKVFTPLIQAVYHRGGFISSFAGDAATALFPRDSLDDSGSGARDVLQCALEMLSWFSVKPIYPTPWTNFQLRSKIGAGIGTIQWKIVEDRSGSAGYEFFGKALNQASEAEHHAETGSITVPRQLSFTDEMLKGIISSELNGFNLLTPTAAILARIHRERAAVYDSPEEDFSINTAKADRMQADTERIRRDTVARFVPVDQFPPFGSGEFRNIVSVFISYDENKLELEEVFRAVADASRRNGGYMNLLDSGDKGGIILVLFGAPIASEQVFFRSVYFAASVREEISNIRIGIAKGSAFTGFVGSMQRATYTALGRVVNLSARLAMHGREGEILVPMDLEIGLPAGMSLESKGSHKFKGIPGELPVGNLTAQSTDRKENISEDHVEGIGRVEKKSFLTEWLNCSESRTAPEVVVISGEAGIGKTQLLEDCLSRLTRPIALIPLSFDTVYQESLSPLKQYFHKQLNDLHEPGDVVKMIDAMILPEFPDYLVNELHRAHEPIFYLAKGITGDSLSALDNQARHERVLEALVAWFEAVFRKTPGVLIIDQAQAMDTSSREFLKRLDGRGEGVTVGQIFLTRNMETFESDQTYSFRHIALSAFSDAELTEAVVRELDVPPSDALLNFLRKRTNAVPLYVFALITYLRQRGFIWMDEEQACLRDVELSSLPPTVHSLTISQYDALPRSARDLLPLLAAIGNYSPPEVLRALQLDTSAEDFGHLVNEGIIRINEDGSLVFVKEFMREAVYELQLSLTLQELHRKVYEAWITAFPDDDSHSLEKAQNLEYAGEIINARNFYLNAAENYRNQYAHGEALEMYEHVILLDQTDPENYLLRLRTAEIHELEGRWSEAFQELIRGMGLAVLNRKSSELFRFFSFAGKILLQQNDFSQAEQMLLRAIRDPELREVHPSLINARIDLARVYMLQGNHSNAMLRLFEARDLAIEIRADRELGLSLYYLGRVYNSRSKRQQARTALQESLELFEKLNDPRLIANPLYDLGILYRDMGQLDTASNYFEQAVKLYSGIGYKSGLSATLLNLGLVEDQRGDFEAAEEYFNRSINIAREIGEPLAMAYSRFSLGASSFKRGNYALAKEHLTEAHASFEQIGATSYLGYSWSYLVTTYVRLEQFNEALEVALTYLSHLGEGNEDVEHGRLYLGLGELFEFLEFENRGMDFEDGLIERLLQTAELPKASAAHAYRKAVKESAPIRYINTLIPGLQHFGEYLYRRGHLQKAYEYLQKAISLAEESGWKRMKESLLNRYTELRSHSSKGESDTTTQTLKKEG